MSSNYRLVHYVPDRLLQARIPMAALVQDDAGLHIVRRDTRPSTACLGVRALRIYEEVMHNVSLCKSFDKLPDTVNGMAVLGEPLQAPQADAVRWVETMFEMRDNTATGPLRETQRQVQGANRLWELMKPEKLMVHKTLRHRFTVKKHAPVWMEEAPELPSVSHWFADDTVGRLLLLEPVVLDRVTMNDEVMEIGQTMSAYASVLQRIPHARGTAKLGCYLVGNSRPGERDEVIRKLLYFTDNVYNVEVLGHRRALAHAISTATGVVPRGLRDEEPARRRGRH